MFALPTIGVNMKQAKAPPKKVRKRKSQLGLSPITADPFHLWHVQVAQCAWDQFGLQAVWFIPSGDPPHKDGITDKYIRLRMVKAGARGNKHFKVSDREIRRPGKSFTILTLREMKSEVGDDVELNLIIGLDNVEQIKRWKEADEIVKLCRLLIAPRNTFVGGRQAIAAALPTGARFEMIDCPDSGISSTLIRNWRKNGRARSADYLYPNTAVRNIVNRHRLYL